MRGKGRKNPRPRHVVLHHDESEDASYERERGARSHDRTSADQMRSRVPGSAVQCILEVVSQSSAQASGRVQRKGRRDKTSVQSGQRTEDTGGSHCANFG